MDRPGRFHVTVRFSIITLVAALLLAAGGVILGISRLGARQQAYHLTESLFREVGRSVAGRTESFLSAATRAAQVTEDLLASRQLDAGSVPAVWRHFASVLRANPEFGNVQWGRPDGEYLGVKRMLDDSLSRRRIVIRGRSVTTTWLHDNPAHRRDFRDGTEPLDRGYDCRTRDWYKLGLSASEGAWTDVYILASDKNIGFGHVRSVRDRSRGGRGLGVFSITVTFSNISYFLDTLRIGEHGQAFILNDRGDVVARPLRDRGELSRLLDLSEADGRRSYVFRPAAQSDDPVIRSCAAAADERRARGETGDELFSFRAGQESYLGMVFPLRLGTRREYGLGIAIPESEIMSLINRKNRLLLFFGLLSIAIAVLLGVELSRSISEPLAVLAEEAERIRELDLDSERSVETRILEVSRISDSFGNMRRGLRSFKKYVPADLVRQLMRLGREAVIEGERRELTMFFSDIADFTAISERLAPDELVEALRLYFAGMTRAVLAERGTVDKYIGDAVMAFWNAPELVPDHAAAACRAALACQRGLDVLAADFAAQGRPQLRTRIGLHTGEATVGNMGFEERLNYTIIGDHVNLASRLEGLNKRYGTRILISEETLRQAGPGFAARKLDVVAVKGKSQGVAIYELAGERDGLPADQAAFLAAFNEAMESYLRREFDRAARAFEDILGRGPDVPARLLLERCRAFAASPPPPDWAGVEVLREK